MTFLGQWVEMTLCQLLPRLQEVRSGLCFHMPSRGTVDLHQEKTCPRDPAVPEEKTHMEET